MSRRDTYRYHFRKGKAIVHSGITYDLERREQEHQQKYGDGKISQVGPKVSRESAKDWEKKQNKA